MVDGQSSETDERVDPGGLEVANMLVRPCNPVMCGLQEPGSLDEIGQPLSMAERERR